MTHLPKWKWKMNEKENSATRTSKNNTIPDFPLSSLFVLQSFHWPRRSLLSAWVSSNLNTSVMPKLTTRSALVSFFPPFLHILIYIHAYICLYCALLSVCICVISDESLQEFSSFLRNLEDQRELMVSTTSWDLHQTHSLLYISLNSLQAKRYFWNMPAWPFACGDT